jgi:hypothetical protein
MVSSGGYGFLVVCERLELPGAEIEIEPSRQDIRVTITAPVLGK